MRKLCVFIALVLFAGNAIAQIRIIAVEPSTNTVTIKNFGGITTDISGYRFCSLIKYTSNLTTGVTINSGSMNLTVGSEVEIVVPGGASSSWQDLQAEADLGLYLPTGGFGTTGAMVDFVQWGSGGHGRESVAVTKGIWVAGEFVPDNEPFSYTGDGAQNGASFWQGTTTNQNPTDIQLSNSEIMENQAVATEIATLSTIDPDMGDTHTYSLVAGTGDADNSSFSIDGTSLESAEIFDFETKESYSIRVETDDGNGGTFAKSFAITITNENDDPTDIDLDNTTIMENVISGTTVGGLSSEDEDTGNNHSYSLVAGSGDDDNASFAIDGANLKSATVFDFETKETYSVRVQTDDNNGGIFSKSFSISISNENDAPTEISLDNATIDENTISGTSVGTFSSEDQDTGDSHTYTLVAGTGDDDNSSFTIDGEDLESTESFNFEIQEIYSVRIQTDDGNGGIFSQALIIDITDVNDDPTDLSLTSALVIEKLPIGTTVGTFETDDEDEVDDFAYSLIAGVGDTDNASFTIDDDQLETAEIFDVDVKDMYTIRVQTNDGNGGLLEAQFDITVIDDNVNLDPTDITLSNNMLNENLPPATFIGTLEAEDPNPADDHVFTLVSGIGDDDNALFIIQDDELQSAQSFNFETKSQFSIRIQAEDDFAGTYAEAFAIVVNDVNDPPSEISISENKIAENGSVDTVVGTLSTEDEDSGDTHIYSLVSGLGDEDNALFQISGDMLKATTVFNFEVKSSYTVRVQSDDGNSGIFSQALEIIITDVNDIPTDLTITNASIGENMPVGTTIGNFITTDEDAADEHQYMFISGVGDDDNSSFAITGGTLESAETFDFETKSTYAILVQSDDGNSGTISKVIAIDITNRNEAPTDISLSNASAERGVPIGTTIADLQTTDVDAGDSHSYLLVSGTGDDNNDLFEISGSALKTKEELDNSLPATLSLRIRSTDFGGETLEKALEISIGTVVSIDELNQSVLLPFPNPFSDQIFIPVRAKAQKIKLELYDIGGKKVFSQLLGVRDQVITFSPAKAGLKPGNYNYVILNEGGRLIAQGRVIRK